MRIQEIDEAASDWLVRRDSGLWTQEDDARLQEWLESSTANRVAFLRLELAWEETARLKALGAGIQGDHPPPPGSWNLTPFFESAQPNAFYGSTGPLEGAESSVLSGKHSQIQSVPGRVNRRRTHRFAMATFVLLAMGGAMYYTLVPNSDLFATPVGGLASIPMADGSNVTLNTDSQIHVQMTPKERAVELNRGEAFFEVSKDPNRPFVVRAGGKSVIAVGTKFSVRREGNDIDVVVTEGKVRVSDADEPATFQPAGSADVFLTSGSIARAGEAGVLVERKTLPEAEEQLSWRKGVLIFRDETLFRAVAEFNRYNARKLVIQDPGVGSLRIEGNFRATNIEAFVRLVEGGFPVHAVLQSDQIILTAR